MRCRDSERPDHLLFVEAKQFASGSRTAEYAGGAGNVKTALVMRGIDGHADTALGFDAEDECVHEIFAARVLSFAEGEDRRCDRPRRVNDGLEVRVVVIEHV